MEHKVSLGYEITLFKVIIRCEHCILCVLLYGRVALLFFLFYTLF